MLCKSAICRNITTRLSWSVRSPRRNRAISRRPLSLQLANGGRMFLIAEYCKGPFYMGWHLYLRDHRAFRQNNDGSWGWVRMSGWSWMNPRVLRFLSSIGIEMQGDGTCDYDGIAEFARRYPIHGRRCGIVRNRLAHERQ